MFKFVLPTLFVTTALFSTNVWADEDGSYVNYENIVNELKASADEKPPVSPTETYDWDDVAMHGGVALATSWVAPVSPDGQSGSGLLKGIQFTLGMNLFSKKVRAEGSFSNYTQSELDSRLRADLKEFELRMVFLPFIRDNLNLRFGAGLSTRYMNLSSLSNSGWTTYEETTPTTILLFGFERKVSKSISLGPDLAYHSTLVSDTFDKSSWNASFHLNATF